MVLGEALEAWHIPMGFTLDAVVAGLRDGDVLSAEEKAQFVLAGFVKVQI